MCRPPAEAELMPDPADTPALPTEAARLAAKKPDYYSSLPAVTIGRRRREAIACDLARLSAMAVGGHCFKNALASLQPLLQLGAARYGALMAAIGAPGATVTPLLGGLAFDAHPRRAAIVFASVALLGGAICAGGLVQGSPAAVLAGGVVLGVGHGCLVVASRAIASERKEDQAYAQGVLAAFANLGAWAGRAAAAPLAVKTGTVATPLAAALAVQTLSLGAAATAPSVRRARRRPADCPFFASQRYWLVAGAHACVFGSFKVFEQFSSAIFVQRFSYDVRTAGLMASSVPLLSAVLAPYAGRLADRASMTQRNACTALMLGIAALAVLALCAEVSRIQLLGCVGCVALGHAVLPTLLLARLRATLCSASSVGVAFGACEALAAAAHVLANLAFAYFHGKRAYGGAMGLLAALLALGFGLFVRSAHLGPAPPRRSRTVDSPVSPTSMPVSFV